jgi:hypothetical protein
MFTTDARETLRDALVAAARADAALAGRLTGVLEDLRRT